MINTQISNKNFIFSLQNDLLRLPASLCLAYRVAFLYLSFLFWAKKKFAFALCIRKSDVNAKFELHWDNVRRNMKNAVLEARLCWGDDIKLNTLNTEGKSIIFGHESKASWGAIRKRARKGFAIVSSMQEEPQSLCNIASVLLAERCERLRSFVLFCL